MEKKVYEQPSVEKVEFELNERIAASGCTDTSGFVAKGMGAICFD